MPDTLLPSLRHPSARKLLEKTVHQSQLVWPVFVTHRSDDKDLPALGPDNKQWGRGNTKDKPFNSLLHKLRELRTSGLRHLMLFGVVEAKDDVGSLADSETDCPVISCIKAIRQKADLADICIYADLCLCEYTSHGHCGVLHEYPRVVEKQLGQVTVDSEATAKRLGSIAVAYAKAGADCVCPSDMMDGRQEILLSFLVCIRISEIKSALSLHGYGEAVMIMAYTSKKASVMYAPFRDAVESTFKGRNIYSTTPSFPLGDRKCYQQPVGSAGIAQRALKRDISEGADIVLVKPSLMYCDIISDLAKGSEGRSVAAYVVSGEAKMLRDYGNAADCLSEVVREAHVSLVRAGASVLITYFTPEILRDWLKEW